MDLNKNTVITLTAPQTIALSANTASTGVAITNKYVRVTATTDCFFLFGASNVAPSVTTGHRLVANVPYDFRKVDQYISFIAVNAGTVYISEITY